MIPIALSLAGAALMVATAINLTPTWMTPGVAFLGAVVLLVAGLSLVHMDGRTR